MLSSLDTFSLMIIFMGRILFFHFWEMKLLTGSVDVTDDVAAQLPGLFCVHSAEQ